MENGVIVGVNSKDEIFYKFGIYDNWKQIPG
jgi:hypothetical protein